MNQAKRKWDVDSRTDTLNYVSNKKPFLESENETRLNRSKWDYQTNNVILLTHSLLDVLLPTKGFSMLALPQHAYQTTNLFYIQTSFPTVKSSNFILQDFDELTLFGSILNSDINNLSLHEVKQYKSAQLILNIKNGDNILRRNSFRVIVERASDLDLNFIFSSILKLLNQGSLDETQRHVFFKLLSRLICKHKDHVYPFGDQIFLSSFSLLKNQNHFIRSEGRELVSDYLKAIGFSKFVFQVKSFIETDDESARLNFCRIVSIASSIFGLKTTLNFLKAMILSKRNWQTVYTGIKCISFTASSLGISILPYIEDIFSLLKIGFQNENIKIRVASANSIYFIATACTYYGNSFYETILPVIWDGCLKLKGKPLSAFIRCFSKLIDLVPFSSSSYYARESISVMRRELKNPDPDLRFSTLTCLKTAICLVSMNLNESQDLLDEIIENTWNSQLISDKRFYFLCVSVSVAISRSLGVGNFLPRILHLIKDESESVKMLALDSIASSLVTFGASGLSDEFLNRLVDNICFAAQESIQDPIGFTKSSSIIFTVFGNRMRSFISKISNIIMWNISNRNPKARLAATELISSLIPFFSIDASLMTRINLLLYENLGEEFPDVLAGILKAILSILIRLGVDKFNPHPKELIPKILPVLRNRNDKVQEFCIEIIGLIAEQFPEVVSAREWIRISFELLDLLRSPKRYVRRACIVTFGHIAKAIGPHDVISALLNNLKVQERQNRICTTIAIAIVAESCSPFTVLPAIMNEYRVPELNVQNGVLKSLSFIFEYVGEIGKDYIYSVTTLLEDALMERDLVHRQTAALVIKHIAMSSIGFGCEDAFIHLLNLLWPNIFETSPHIITFVIEAIQTLSIVLGPATIMQYVFSGLFHPARRVRSAYWRIFNNLYIDHSDSMIPFYPQPFEPELRPFFLEERC